VRKNNEVDLTVAKNIRHSSVNPLEYKGNYSATLNNMKLVCWLMMGVGCYIWYSEEGTGQAGPGFSLLYQM